MRRHRYMGAGGDHDLKNSNKVKLISERQADEIKSKVQDYFFIDVTDSSATLELAKSDPAS